MSFIVSRNRLCLMPINPIIRVGLIVGVIGATLAGCAEKPAPVSTSPPPFYRNLEAVSSPLDIGDAAQVISTYRVGKNLSPVVIDPALVGLAQEHASAQARANKTGHNIGGTFAARIKTLEGERGASVENVSAGYRSFAEAFSGWRESPNHNANLLNPKVTRLGIAKAVNPESKYKVFWTLVMTSEPRAK